jgi:hypothetical protein
MGIVTDYFAAPGDALAATVLHEASGPSTPTRGSGRPLFDTVCLPSIEPFVMLGTLAQLLSGRPYGEVTARPRHGSLVVDGGDEGPWVVTVSDDLVADLAARSPARLADVAWRWSRSPELSSIPTDRVVTAVLALGELAARADQVRHRVYCWTCLEPPPAEA